MNQKEFEAMQEQVRVAEARIAQLESAQRKSELAAKEAMTAEFTAWREHVASYFAQHPVLAEHPGIAAEIVKDIGKKKTDIMAKPIADIGPALRARMSQDAAKNLSNG